MRQRRRMKYNSIAAEIEKLTGIESDYINIITNYKSEHGKHIIASSFFYIPPEINAAFDILTLKIPEFVLNKTDHSRDQALPYDVIVSTERASCCNKKVSLDYPEYTFNIPEGYGEDASVSLHNEIMLMLKNLFNIDIKSIDIETLQKQTAVYEKLRRIIRSISALRGENRTLLSNSELSSIFETALILPPEIAIEYINPIFEEMKKISGADKKFNARGLIYGGRIIPSVIADHIEDMGVLLVEDDSCTGRRLFDISLNADSEFIFYELLDAYSYRSLTPCLRPVHERYELLYKLLKNYNIETVVFFKDENCSDSVKEIEYLRIKMMRDGIDPLVIDKDNYQEIFKGYLSRL